MEPYRQTVDDALAALETDARSGLSRRQADERLERYGRNELAAEKPVPAWRKFLGQFTDLYVAMGMLAGIIIGTLLFGAQYVVPGLVSFLIILLGATALQLGGVLPYAPVYDAAPYAQGKFSTDWFFRGVGGVTFLTLIALGALLCLLLDRWREREQRLECDIPWCSRRLER